MMADATTTKGLAKSEPEEDTEEAGEYDDEACELAGQTLLDALDIKGDAHAVGQALQDSWRAFNAAKKG